MSKLFKVLYDIADIRCRYQRIHEEVFGFSARRILKSLQGAASGTSSAQSVELDRLLSRLDAAQQDLDHLGEEDLSIRRGGEIQSALMAYARALSQSNVGRLRRCRAVSEALRQKTQRIDFQPLSPEAGSVSGYADQATPFAEGAIRLPSAVFSRY